MLLSSTRCRSGTYLTRMVAKSGCPVIGHRHVNSGISRATSYSVLPDLEAVPAPTDGGASSLELTKVQPDHRAQPEFAHFVVGHERPARKQRREAGKGEGYRILAERAKTLGRVHDLRGGARRIAVEGAHGRPGMRLAELIGEAV